MDWTDIFSALRAVRVARLSWSIKEGVEKWIEELSKAGEEERARDARAAYKRWDEQFGKLVECPKCYGAFKMRRLSVSMDPEGLKCPRCYKVISVGDWSSHNGY